MAEGLLSWQRDPQLTQAEQVSSPTPDLTFLDRIELRGLRVVTIVGVLPEERVRAQPLELDLDLYGDLRAAGETDDLDKTVNYGTVTTLVTEICHREHAQLLERLAHVVADELCALDGVVAATATVRKLRPPVPEDLASSAVCVTRMAP
ncbi:MAG: dihydroneopterin aldolase [Candidatus Poriferisodalaceae bacterium]